MKRYSIATIKKSQVIINSTVGDNLCLKLTFESRDRNFPKLFSIFYQLVLNLMQKGSENLEKIVMKILSFPSLAFLI